MSHEQAVEAALGIGDAVLRLAVARGGAIDDVAAEVYVDGLRDLEPGYVRRACAELARVARREFDTVLPSVGAIRERVREIAGRDAAERDAARLLPAPKPEIDAPTFFCLDCQDEPNGWAMRWCAGSGQQRTHEKPDRVTGITPEPCGRLNSHVHHTFVVRCRCLDTNPVIAQHRERMRVSQAKRAGGRAS